MRLVYTPAARGGDRNKGIERWHDALTLFATERSDAVLPDWGHAEAWAWLAGLQLRSDPPQRAEAKRSVERALELRPGWMWVTKSVLPRF